MVSFTFCVVAGVKILLELPRGRKTAAKPREVHEKPDKTARSFDEDAAQYRCDGCEEQPLLETGSRSHRRPLHQFSQVLDNDS